MFWDSVKNLVSWPHDVWQSVCSSSMRNLRFASSVVFDHENAADSCFKHGKTAHSENKKRVKTTILVLSLNQNILQLNNIFWVVDGGWKHVENTVTHDNQSMILPFKYSVSSGISQPEMLVY